MTIHISDCDKVIRFGKVAVLYSPGFGAGWFSWHHDERLLFDPAVVDMIERGADPSEIVEYCEDRYKDSDIAYWGGADDLTIMWLPEGAIFRIDEYDGNESVVLQDDDNWIVA